MMIQYVYVAFFLTGRWELTKVVIKISLPNSQLFLFGMSND